MDAIELKIAMDKELLTSDQKPSKEALDDVVAAAAARGEQIAAGDLVQWLADRLTNSLRLAAFKQHDDRAGWIEDAAHYAAAIKFFDILSK